MNDPPRSFTENLGLPVYTQPSKGILTKIANSSEVEPSCVVGQVVGFGVEFAGDVRDGKIEATGQLAADPVQRVEARAAANVFSLHLPDYHLGVGVDVELSGFLRHGILQRFEQGNVFRDVIILASNPFRDPDSLSC
jgi:hypothetical protein